MILAGDVGGTKTNVALLESDEQGALNIKAQQTFASRDFPSLEAIVEKFTGAHKEKVSRACFGVAGPVIGGRVQTPNLHWSVDAETLAHTLSLERVNLINDLEANAHGIEALTPEKFFILNEGVADPNGNRALISAGTGLGTAGIYNQVGHYHPFPSEGGHVDFAARNELELELFRHLSKKFGGHVSVERVISGPGLFNVYEFLRDSKYAEEPDWLTSEISEGDSSAAISAAALSRRSELAVKALDIFTSVYGAVAGNLALIMLATGGVFVGGGVSPKILEKLKDGTFMRAFTDKGRHSGLVGRMPVRVILDDKTALYGAARCAIHL